jgi:hypothetical protein
VLRHGGTEDASVCGDYKREDGAPQASKDSFFPPKTNTRKAERNSQKTVGAAESM